MWERKKGKQEGKRGEKRGGGKRRGVKKSSERIRTLKANAWKGR